MTKKQELERQLALKFSPMERKKQAARIHQLKRQIIGEGFKTK